MLTIMTTDCTRKLPTPTKNALEIGSVILSFMTRSAVRLKVANPVKEEPYDRSDVPIRKGHARGLAKPYRCERELSKTQSSLIL